MRKMKSWLGSLMFAAGMVALSSSPLWAQGGGYYGRDSWGPHMMMGFGGGWFGGIFMIIIWVLVIAALIGGVRWLWQASAKSGRPPVGEDRPLVILKERYARGEIDRDQFEAMKKDLLA